MRTPLFVLLCASLLAGCGLGRDEISRKVDSDVRESDVMIRESRTLSSLAKLEEALAAYIKHEGKIPAKLDQLIPQYLGEIPTVEIGVKGHSDNALVKIYPADVLRDGQITGTRILDTGKWGYVFNDRQVVVFVDCTHNTSRGKPWFQERGVY